MKKIMMLAWACLLSIAMLSAQGVEEVTLVVSGDGPTKEEATHVALRSAIEQAFGCFVSANTEILNDSLVKDEIVTISNGSISSYEEINVTELDSALLSVTLRATVSVNKLISYAKSKGSSCELSGALLTQEKRMLEMNIANTKKALNHLFTLVNEYVEKNDLWEYTFKIDNVKMNGYVTGEITCKRNKNGDNLVKMIRDYIANISINENQVEHLKELGFEAKVIGIEPAPTISIDSIDIIVDEKIETVYMGLIMSRAERSGIDPKIIREQLKQQQKKSREDEYYKVEYEYNKYYTYADFSCVSKELIRSIDKNIGKRACVLFTDNLGFVYPVIPGMFPTSMSRSINVLITNDPTTYGGEKRITNSINMQIPDQNIAALSNIELVPYSDPRFTSLVDSTWQQAWQYYERLNIDLNEKIKQQTTNLTKEEKYYFFNKIALYFSIRERIFTPNDYTEEAINQLKKFLKNQELGWASMSFYAPDYSAFSDAAYTILVEIEKMLVQVEGEEYKKQIIKNGAPFQDGNGTHHVGIKYNFDEVLWKPWDTSYYFQNRTTISE